MKNKNQGDEKKEVYWAEKTRKSLAGTAVAIVVVVGIRSITSAGIGNRERWRDSPGADYRTERRTNARHKCRSKRFPSISQVFNKVIQKLFSS